MISAYRPADDADYVYHTWLQCMAGADWAKAMPSPHYYRAQKLLIDDLLGRSTVLVHRSLEVENAIRGYVVGEVVDGRPIVHWVYTRSSRRRQGIANALFGALAVSLGVDLDGGAFTHFRLPGARVLERQGMAYEPFYLRDPRRKRAV